MSNKKLSGKSLDLAGMNQYYFGQADPDAINLPPEALKRLHDRFWPKLKTKPVGKIIIFGTAGELK